MSAIIPEGKVGWGFQLPVQSQSTNFVQPWEASAGPDELLRITKAADAAGAFYVGVCDHVAIPNTHADVMSTTWYDTVATMAWLAAHTVRVNLLSHVYVLPYRHVLSTAKAFMTLDALSGGRVILGAGAGHVEAEFVELGIDFDSRGKAVADIVPQLRAAFSNEFVPATADHDDAAVTSFGLAPRAVRDGGPPIWLGGSSKAAIRRAALLADGWLPQGPPPMGTRQAIELIHSERADAGLPEQFDLGIILGPVYLGTPGFEVPQYTTVGSADQVIEMVNKVASRGMNQVQFRFLGSDASEVVDQILRFGEEVAPAINSAINSA